jgi:putative phage-type endonuclease
MKKEEWQKWRSEGLGASDAPVIMGISKWKTAHELWLEKTGQKDSDYSGNFVTDKGHELEAIARAAFELQTMKHWAPANLEYKHNPRIRASLDGYDPDTNAILEIKYLGKDAYAALCDNEDIPEHYWPQLMQQILVTGAEDLNFVGINEAGEIATLYMAVSDREWKYINEQLLPALNRFLVYIDTKTPPPLSSKDQYLLKNEAMESDLEKYFDLKKQMEVLEKRVTDIAAIYHDNVRVGKYTIKKSKISQDRASK